jgi:hypothetical protein
MHPNYIFLLEQKRHDGPLRACHCGRVGPELAWIVDLDGNRAVSIEAKL